MKPYRSIAFVVAFVVASACTADGPALPGGPEPPADETPPTPDLSARVLPEGTYDITYASCEGCVAGSAPDYLLTFSEGVRGVVAISDAGAWNAGLRLVEMRAGESPPTDILDLFGSPVVVLFWNGGREAFEGRVAYGAAAEFVPAFRVSAGILRCELDLAHAKHDVGPTSCTVTERPAP